MNPAVSLQPFSQDTEVCRIYPEVDKPAQGESHNFHWMGWKDEWQSSPVSAWFKAFTLSQHIFASKVSASLKGFLQSIFTLVVDNWKPSACVCEDLSIFLFFRWKWWVLVSDWVIEKVTPAPRSVLWPWSALCRVQLKHPDHHGIHHGKWNSVRSKCTQG